MQDGQPDASDPPDAKDGPSAPTTLSERVRKAEERHEEPPTAPFEPPSEPFVSKVAKPPPPPPEPRGHDDDAPSWKIVFHPGGMVLGVLFGMGMAILLQQLAQQLLTTGSLLLWIVLGLVIAIAGPTIARGMAVQRIRSGAARPRPKEGP